MTSKNDLKDFYLRQVYPQLKGLETERKAIIVKLKRIRLFLFILAVILPVIAISVIQKPLLNMSTFLFDLFVLIPLYFIFASKIKKPYHQAFKSRVVAPVVEAMGEGVLYDPNKSITEKTIRDADIFKKMDGFLGDDYIKGRFLGRDIEFSQVRASYNTYKRNSEGHNEKRSVNLLNGWMFIVDIQREVPEGFVVENKAMASVDDLLGGSALGGLVSGAFNMVSKFLKDDDRYTLNTGDELFDKRFQLRGNKADIEKFLTSEVRKKLLDIGNERGIVLALRDKKLYFGVDSVIDFESSIKKSLEDFQEPMQLMKDIKNAVTLAQNFEEEQEMEMAW